jgi:hypothetical protein
MVLLITQLPLGCSANYADFTDFVNQIFRLNLMHICGFWFALYSYALKG